jgi:hypothetical protein
MREVVLHCFMTIFIFFIFFYLSKFPILVVYDVALSFDRTCNAVTGTEFMISINIQYIDGVGHGCDINRHTLIKRVYSMC